MYCITGHLLTTLSHCIKKSKLAEGQSSECLDILSQLTGITLESVISSSRRCRCRRRVVVRKGVIPLLLRDPITVFIQLYMNMPPHLANGKLIL